MILSTQDTDPIHTGHGSYPYSNISQSSANGSRSKNHNVSPGTASLIHGFRCGLRLLQHLAEMTSPGAELP
ncbi:hypothetical protein RRG08_053261 [Elysia crispata]|uniref:Uncharacterized protein n=1 Tax=Elysia crispata TaxID=231223 RepID=A0AAE1ANG3_9GAST|nr:hypothetical protein RRG08_053261 [Elysia crispata]